jgi:23S rRNA (adenine2030-N6)-methyltransferase
MLQSVKDLNIPKQLRIEHCITADGAVRGMTGSGMLFINPPWQLVSQAEVLLPWLNQVLSDKYGFWKVEWQVPEQIAENMVRN